MNNKEIRKERFHYALFCLTHPISLFFMAIVLVNDFYFQIESPCWLTGKLSDFAWLFFFPFTLAALSVWILPVSILRRRNSPIIIAIIFTGLIFSFGKTWTPFYQMIISVVEWLFNMQVKWVPDSTDLVALVSLCGCLILWMQLAKKNRLLKFQNNTRWVFLCLAILVTMADAAMPDTGIECVSVVDEAIYVQSSYGTYKGSNSGMDWQMVSGHADPQYSNMDCDVFDDIFQRELDVFQIVDITNPDVWYRIKPGEGIDRSDNGGKDWVEDLDSTFYSQAEIAFFSRTASWRISGIRRFTDADFDPVSGNLIVAMRYEGVLVRDASGTYQQVTVGSYHPLTMSLFDILQLLFPGEVIMSVIAGVLSMITFFWNTPRNIVWKIFMILSTLIFIFYGGFASPAIGSNGYGMTFVVYGLLFALALALIALIKMARHRQVTMFIFLTGLITAVVYYLPFILWGYNIFPYYWLAFSISMIIVTIWIVFRHRQMQLTTVKKSDEIKEVQS